VKFKTVQFSDIMKHPNKSLSPSDYIYDTDYGKDGDKSSLIIGHTCENGIIIDECHIGEEEEIRKMEGYVKDDIQSAWEVMKSLWKESGGGIVDFSALSRVGKSRFVGESNAPISSRIDTSHYRNGKTMQLFNMMYRWITEDNATYEIRKEGIRFTRKEEEILIATTNPRQFMKRFVFYKRAIDRER
jgi:hypothetical protein